MPHLKLRREIALRSSQLMYERIESEYFTAKRKAARQFGVDYRFRPADLPSNREIRDQIQVLAQLHEGDARRERLTAMRLEALRLMRRLVAFRPHLIGSVLTGHIRQGSDIDLHCFADSVQGILNALEDAGLRGEVQHKRIIKHDEERFFTHVHVTDRYSYELTVY